MKRRLLILGVFLLAGAVVNVAVAWACVSAKPLPYTDRGQESDPFRSDEETWTLIMREYSDFPLLLAVHQSASGVNRLLLTGADPRHYMIERDYRGGASLSTDDRAVTDQCYCVQAGWPAMSLSGWRIDLDVKDGRVASGGDMWWLRGYSSKHSFTRRSLRLTPRTGMPSDILPLQPLWPGFAINTLVYAAILWLPVAGFGLIRRRRRAARGLCPACAYPVGSSAVCTECGKPVEPRSVEAVT